MSTGQGLSSRGCLPFRDTLTSVSIGESKNPFKSIDAGWPTWKTSSKPRRKCCSDRQRCKEGTLQGVSNVKDSKRRIPQVDEILAPNVWQVEDLICRLPCCLPHVQGSKYIRQNLGLRLPSVAVLSIRCCNSVCRPVRPLGGLLLPDPHAQWLSEAIQISAAMK